MADGKKKYLNVLRWYIRGLILFLWFIQAECSYGSSNTTCACLYQGCHDNAHDEILRQLCVTGLPKSECFALLLRLVMVMLDELMHKPNTFILSSLQVTTKVGMVQVLNTASFEDCTNNYLLHILLLH